jgi:hypothetical protein
LAISCEIRFWLLRLSVLCGNFLVGLRTSFCVENIVGVFNCEPCLVLLRDKATDIFWSCGLEHLDEKEVGEAVDIVVDSLLKGSF